MGRFVGFSSIPGGSDAANGVRLPCAEGAAFDAHYVEGDDRHLRCDGDEHRFATQRSDGFDLSFNDLLRLGTLFERVLARKNPIFPVT